MYESNGSSIDHNKETPLSSSLKSFEPPNEYEQQLQLYEGEVRNHIKVEQQLKLHIEVLQDKIDDLEKDKEMQDLKWASEQKSIEKAFTK